MFMQAYIHTYVRTYVRTYIRTYVYAYVHSNISTHFDHDVASSWIATTSAVSIFELPFSYTPLY